MGGRERSILYNFVRCCLIIIIIIIIIIVLLLLLLLLVNIHHLNLLVLVNSPELDTNAIEIRPSCRVRMPANVDQLQQLVACYVDSNLTHQIRTKRHFLRTNHTHYYFCTKKVMQLCPSDNMEDKRTFLSQ